MQAYKNRRQAIAVTIVGVVTMALLAWVFAPAPTQAAPPGQTVPIPTATPSIDVPEATPTPDAGDDGDDDGDGDEGAVDPEFDDAPTDDAAVGSGQVGEVPLPDDAVSVAAQVGAGEAGVYAGPGTSFALLGVLPPETPVELLGRNAGLAWYVICCLPDGQAGWVAAADLVDAPLADVIALPVLSDWRAEELVAATPTPADGAAELGVTVSYTPQFVRPGDIVTLQFELENLSLEAATDVSLRGDLGDALTFVSGQAQDGAFLAPATGASPAVITAEWPTLSPGMVQIVTVDVRLPDELAPGAVISQLVAVDTANAAAKTAQALIGLPPADMPSFR